MDFARSFRRLAKDFRNILKKTHHKKNVRRFVADVRTQCARLLFKAIDAGLLSSLWSPGSRPLSIPSRDSDGKPIFQACKSEQPQALLDKLAKIAEDAWKREKITPDEDQLRLVEEMKAGMGRRDVPIPDADLSSSQLGQIWWTAIGTLYQEDNSAFPDKAPLDEISHVNDVFEIPDFALPFEDDDDDFDQLRRRATNYACACDLLSEIIESNVRVLNQETESKAGVHTQDTGATGNSGAGQSKAKRGKSGQTKYRRARDRMLILLKSGTLPKSIRGTVTLLEADGFTYENVRRGAWEDDRLKAHFGLGVSTSQAAGCASDDLLGTLSNVIDPSNLRRFEKLDPETRKSIEKEWKSDKPGAKERALELVKTLTASESAPDRPARLAPYDGTPLKGRRKAKPIKEEDRDED